MYIVIFTLLLSYLVSFADSDINELLTPAQFREQELQRIRSGIEKQASTPILSVQADYDVVYYDLNLDVRNYAAKSINGNVGILARSLSGNLDQMVLDLCASMSVDSVRYPGGNLSFSRNLAILTVSLNRIYTTNELVQVNVYYHGTPCDTVTSFGYYTHGNSIPAIASLSEPVGARDWWPCKDNPNDKADSVRVSITCADTLTASSNGLLESVVSVPPSSKTFHFFERHPITTYLVCASVTNYTLLNDWYATLGGDSMPIKHYCFPERLTQAQVSWNNLSQMITFFAQNFNEYPFADEKYGHTMFEWGGGMEHQTNTSLGYFLANGNHVYDWIIAHELSHQWWGDNVTCDTWPDIWLNEGFASYMEALWSEHVGGASALRTYQNGSNSVSDPSGPVYNPTDLFSSNDVYNKGSWILHILRGVIRNDSVFFGAMRYYRSQHEYGTATTSEFLNDMSATLGFDVDAYLHAFIYRTNRPIFRVSFGTGTIDGQRQTVIRIRQTQSNADTTFRTRLDLRLANGADTLRTRVENALRAERYFVNPSFTPSQLSIDPDSWVLKTVINASMTLTILNSDLDNGQQAVAYVDSLVAISGTPPYTWRVIGMSLPSGLVLSTSGVITGTPTVHGTFPITFVVNDNASHADTSILSIHITAPTPPAPAALTVRVVDSLLIELNWQGTNADSFQVFRGTNSDMTDLQLIATVSQTTLQDSVNTATEARRFYFVKGIINP